MFRSRAGEPITGQAHPSPPDGAPPPDPVSPYQHPLGARLDTRWFHYTAAPQSASSRSPSELDPDGIADPHASAAAVIYDRVTDTTPGQPDRAANPAAGPHAPPLTATDAAA